MAVTVGLDIGSSAVRAAVLDAGKDRPVLRRFAEMPLSPGAVSGGEILDEESVTETVAALWKRSKLPKKRVVVGTSSQRLVVRPVDVPQMPEEELKESLPFQVQDSIPIPVDEAVLDFVPLEDFKTPDGEPMRSILVVAVHRDIIDTLMRIAGTAGLTLEAIDLQPFALVRSLFGAEIGGEAAAVVDIGASVTQVVVTRGGIARFVRILPRGGDDFTNALVDGLSVDVDEAIEIKRRVGVFPEDPSTGDDPDVAAARLMTRTADRLIEEIRGSVNFYLSQEPEDQVGTIVVAGNAARLPHLANRLGRTLGMAIKPAKILDTIEVGRVGLAPEEMQAAQPVLPTPVGLALWGAV